MGAATDSRRTRVAMKNVKENIFVQDKRKSSIKSEGEDSFATDNSYLESSEEEDEEEEQEISSKDQTQRAKSAGATASQRKQGTRRAGILRQPVTIADPIYSHVINIGNCTGKTRLDQVIEQLDLDEEQDYIWWNGAERM